MAIQAISEQLQTTKQKVMSHLCIWLFVHASQGVFISDLLAFDWRIFELYSQKRPEYLVEWESPECSRRGHLKHPSKENKKCRKWRVYDWLYRSTFFLPGSAGGSRNLDQFRFFRAIFPSPFAFSCDRFNNIRVNTKGCTLLLATTVEDIQRKKEQDVLGELRKRKDKVIAWVGPFRVRA